MGDDPLKHQRHLDDYRDKKGIKLDPEKVEKNPGLCTLAKMMLTPCGVNLVSVPTRRKSGNLMTPKSFQPSVTATPSKSSTLVYNQTIA